jgi:hypothetical protein
MRTSVAKEANVHVALPKLYGAPAYARPPLVAVQPVDRPFDPDELPLEAVQTEEERALASEIAHEIPEAGPSPEPGAGGAGKEPMLRGRPFRLGAITGRLRGSGGDGTGA